MLALFCLTLLFLRSFFCLIVAMPLVMGFTDWPDERLFPKIIYTICLTLMIYLCYTQWNRFMNYTNVPISLSPEDYTVHQQNGNLIFQYAGEVIVTPKTSEDVILVRVDHYNMFNQFNKSTIETKIKER